MGSAISVPVGDVTLGRVFNVLGEIIDLGEEIPAIRTPRPNSPSSSSIRKPFN